MQPAAEEEREKWEGAEAAVAEPEEVREETAAMQNLKSDYPINGGISASERSC